MGVRTLVLLPFVLVTLGASATSAPLFTGTGTRGASAMAGNGSSLFGWTYARDSQGQVYNTIFRWNLGSGVTLLWEGSQPGALEPSPVDVSLDGSAIAGLSINGPHAFFWSDATGPVGLWYRGESYGWAISGDGSTVVGHGFPNESIHAEAFRWTESGGYEILHSIPTTINSRAFDVSFDGSIILGGADGPGCCGSGNVFLWTDAGGAEWPGLTVSGARLINAGSGIVARSSGGIVRWDAVNGTQPLGFDATFFETSQDGETIIGTDGQGSFVWTSSAGRQTVDQFLATFGLDTGGWSALDVKLISDDGIVFAGDGTNPAGEYETWYAVIPEPSTAVLVSLGIASLGVRSKMGRSRGTSGPHRSQAERAGS